MGALDGFVPPPPAPARAAVLQRLAAALSTVGPGRRVVIAIDGTDGAGKTVLADELATLIGAERPVVRAGIDGFHHPRARRYRHGRTPESFYEDSYDLEALVGRLLEPFRAGAQFAVSLFDVERDTPRVRLAGPAGADVLLLLDGIFLHRPELAGLWDASVWVEVPFAVSVPRGNARFGDRPDHPPDPDAPANARYVAAQREYLRRHTPAARATWVVDNTDLDRPLLAARGAEKGGAPGPAGP